MSVDTVMQLLIQYKYWILVPLSIIEGPVVAFVAGTLSAVGFFNFYALAIVFFVRDVGMDLGYYALGHFGGRTRFTQQMMKKIGVSEDHLERVRAQWERRPALTMLIGKLSYGIAAAFIVVAGMVKMPLKVFIGYGSLVAVLQYGTLLVAGYFLGNAFGGSAAELINNAQYFFAVIAIAITGYYLLSWKMRKKFIETEREVV